MKLSSATWGAFACLFVACGGGGGESGGGFSENGLTCSDVVACGGEVEGVWKISSNCAIGDLAQLMSMTLVGEDPPKACRDQFRNFTMTMAGTMTFAAGVMTRNVEETWEGTLHFTPGCLSETLGEKVETVNASMCRRMEGQLLTDRTTKSASCAVASGSCDCDTVGSNEQTSDEQIRIEGDQIVRRDGEGTHTDFCVSGTTLKLKEESYELPGFAMITTLERK